MAGGLAGGPGATVRGGRAVELSVTVKQVFLAQGNRRLICWVEDRREVKPGARLTLKGESGWWSVIDVGLHLDQSQLNHKWQVGGL